MQLKSMFHTITGIAAIAAAIAAAPASAITLTNGNTTVNSIVLQGTGGVLRYRNGVPGKPNLNLTVNCTLSFSGHTLANGTYSVPVSSLLTVDSATFSTPGSFYCPSVSLKNASSGTTVPPATVPGNVTSATTGELAQVELSQTVLGDCIAKPSQVITFTWSNASGGTPAKLSLQPFTIGQTVAAGDPADDYCSSSSAIVLSVTTPSTPSAQPIISP